MKSKRFFLSLGIILIFTNLTITLGFPQKSVPLPQEIEIIPPPSDLPPEVAAFSGRWEGLWGGERESILIVAEIDSEKAKVIYAWGDNPRMKPDKGYSKHVAKVIPGAPAKIEWGGGERPKFTFKMGKDFKSIRGIREFRDSYVEITMKRVER